MSMEHATPRLTVVDPRYLPVRSVDYCRIGSGPTQRRINRSLFDAAGRTTRQWDPRLWRLYQEDESVPANLSMVYSLSDVRLFTLSVDAGRRIDLPGLASEGLRSWDGRGTRKEAAYDDLLRPVAVFEQSTGQPYRCVERMKYGYPGQGNRDHNQFGQLIRHDDPAGSVLLTSFSLLGHNLDQQRRFVLDAAIPDWPAPEGDREPLLEPGEGARSSWRLGPQGNVLEQLDARDNRQRHTLTLDGRLASSQLLLQGQSQWQPLVSDIGYNAEGRIERETAGNGVQTRLTYSPEDGRLTQRHARRGDQVLQHLVYAYDPMGNVLGIEDRVLPVRYFANQRIEPVSRFTYDTLYQLIEATGWEAGSANQGPESVGRNDPAAVSNYRQTYRYDESGNLLELTHVGVQHHGHRMKAARYSNRCLSYRDDAPPTEEEIDAAFDAQGNCLELEGGRLVVWDLRNQLSSVTSIERASGRNDSEVYVYDGSGLRVRKLRTLQAATRTLAAEVRYLPGLKLRADSATGESLQVITARGGLNSVQVLRWERTPPSGVNDHYRYSFSDHLGSVGLELDHDGRIISREHFYPFGETAYLAGEDVIEVSYKTVRYSGKERDATGLYYYGFRYYAPWLQRWMSPDPAGEVDGLNVYRMVLNNPLTFFDEQGEGALSDTSLTSAIGIYATYKDRYSDTDRQLPFTMMADITGNALNFKNSKAPPSMLEKAKEKRFTLRHYTSGEGGKAPAFETIAPFFSLIYQEIKKLGGKGGNTAEKDWTKAGNIAFTFFLLAVDGQVNERRFLQSTTHFAEYDLEDDKALEAALGVGFEQVEFFASPDVLHPEHAANLGAVPAVKGRLKDLKALLLGNSGLSPVQVKTMDSAALLEQIDRAFGGSLEIKIPGSVNVKSWYKKPMNTAARRLAA
ncbi:RHS repeat domain-containing protein [Pseudomonas sp. Pf153]|uniref:RHS repeat domain-containing protein n=1 Tax=Pseudomonas sp. Pf153 TaxID=1699309 RepID=UPI00069FDCF5|nr:RHS repeat-associated core domain-containing protein [Pseudomonas sp. Pf153]